MDTQNPTPATQDRPITVDVPEDRVPEFYAWYARFLAGDGPRGRRRGRHGGPGHRGHRHCGPGHREGHGPHGRSCRSDEQAPGAETQSPAADA